MSNLFIFQELIDNNLYYNYKIIILLFIMVRLFTFCIIKCFDYKKLLNNQNLKIINLEAYNKNLLVMYDSVSSFRKEYDYFVNVLNKYALSNDMESISKITKNVIKECQEVNALDKLNPSIINNPAIYSLLMNKYYIAFELGIKFNIDVHFDLNKINIPMYKVIKILGILIDNAIEAANLCDDKIVNVKFLIDDKFKRKLVLIENSYMNKDVNIDQIFEKGYSSKGESEEHGLGLWTVRKMLKEFNNLNLYTVKDELFKQQFEVYDE